MDSVGREIPYQRIHTDAKVRHTTLGGRRRFLFEANVPAYGVKVFGVTIHQVDATLDGGRIIAQRAFAYEGDDAAELERLVHAVEYPLYVETIRRLLDEMR